MKSSKILWIIVISIIIMSILPTRVLAVSNDFKATLLVSDTLVPQGTTITSNITIKNLDPTFGADIAISYNGVNISSFHLNANHTKSIQHDILINEQIDIVYKVYASHGPDISKTKNTNIVRVYIEQPATSTPIITPEITALPSAVITQASTIIPTAVATLTPTPTYTPAITIVPITETMTQTSHIEITNTPNTNNTNNIGWGEPITRTPTGDTVLSHLSDTHILEWLGYNAMDKVNTSNNYTNDETTEYKNMQDVYKTRRWLFWLFVLLILVLLMLIIVIIKKSIKKNK